MTNLLFNIEAYGTCDRCGKTKTGLHHNNWDKKQVRLCKNCSMDWHVIWSIILNYPTKEKQIAFIEFMKKEERETVQFT